MIDLTKPSELRPLLARHGIELSKRFGQNFLVSRVHLEKAVAAAGITDSDFVFEIGPGAGVLTIELARRAGRVLAVELDRKLPPVLAEVMAEFPNFTLIQDDALKMSWDGLFPIDQTIKVAANIPYNITSPLLVKLLEHTPKFASITLLVQKEVADRLKSGPNDDFYGSLSVFTQFYASVTVPVSVPRNAFFPPPKVDSAVIHLIPHRAPIVETPSPEAFFAVSRAAFGQRRKMLLGALSHGMDRPRPEILAALETANVAGDRRAETLTLAEIAAISRALF
jgi:16S rRNA (adenine1518-N6/adenine1519-N6)-dimethyltransferase